MSPPTPRALAPGLMVVLLLGAAAFGVALGTPDAVLDDAAFLAHDVRVRDPAQRHRVWDTPLGWVHRHGVAPQGQGAYYRPVPLLTIGWVFDACGPDPRPQRLLNLLGHLALGAALFGLLARPWGGAVGAAAALLFLLHPVHAEVVAFFSGRFDLAAVLFPVLAAGLARRGPERPAVWLGAGALLLLACLSKESALALCLLVPAAALTGREAAPGPRATRAWLALPPLVWVLTLGMRRLALGQALPGVTSPGGLLVHAPGSLLVYLEHLVWPTGLQPFGYAPGTTPGPGAALGLGLLVLALGRLQRRGRLAAVSPALLLLVLPLLPVLDPTALPLPLADRYLYGPALGLAWLVGEVLGTLDPERRRAGALGVGLAALVGGSLLVARQPAFVSGRALAEDLGGRPQVPEMLRDFLAQRRAEARLEGAGPGAGPLAAAQLASLRGDLPGALAAVEVVLATAPADPAARLLRAELLSRLERPVEARAAFEALLHEEENPRARVGLALLEAAAGRLPAAREQLDRALAVAPDDPWALRVRAAVLERLGDAAGAARDRVRAEARGAGPGPGAP